MLASAKGLVLEGIRGFGLNALVARTAWREQRLLILCYHGTSIDDEHEWDPTLYVSPAHFERRMEQIRRCSCAVLPLVEAVERLDRGELPPRAVTITFDDGHHDFYVHAYPILQRFGYPATVYLTTYYCNYQRPVFDMVLSYILWKGRGDIVDVSDLAEGLTTLDLRTDGSRVADYHRVIDVMRPTSADEKDELSGAIAQRLGVDYEELVSRRVLTLMNPDEVREVSRGSIDIQLHTHRHRTPRDRDLFVREIRDNRDSIEKINGVRPNHLCYPSGDHDPSFLPWLEAEGVASAVTCRAGLAAPDTPRLLLPRLLDRASMPDAEFEAWLSGISEWIPRRSE